MKLSKIIPLAILFTCSHLTTAFANHDGDGVSRLRYDAQQLNYQVQSSYLRSSVKAAVIQFVTEVDRLSNCLSTESPLAETIHVMDHHDGDANYGYQLQRVQNAWAPVERYLYDSYSDEPRIYQLYQQTRQDLYELLGQGRPYSMSSDDAQPAMTK
jgi:hypothetical protein